MTRRSLPGCMTLVLLVPALAAAVPPEKASSWLGVEVDIPASFGWEQGVKQGSVAIKLVGEGELSPARILINCVGPMTTEMTQEEMFRQTRDTFSKESYPDVRHLEVKLTSGRFLRVDYTIEVKGGAREPQRCYATLRNRHLYYFFFANLPQAKFERHLESFAAMVAGARFMVPKDKPDPAPKPKVEEDPVTDAKQGEKQPATRPAKAPKKGPRTRPMRSLLTPNSLVLFDSEYDPDIWAARHLVDGKARRGWCSAPVRRPPHRFVFALSRPAEVAAASFDNKCPEEEDYRGVPSKEFLVEGSILGPERGYSKLLGGSLKSGVNGQVFRLEKATRVRWVRLTLRNNHGHLTLTELMEFRLLAEPGARKVKMPLEAFHLDRVRVSRTKNGPAVAKGASFAAGKRVWINFKPRAQATNSEGKAWLEVDLVLEDAAKNQLVRRNKVVNHVARPPAAPLSAFVSVFLDLPAGFPPGRYVVRVIGRDRFAKTSAAAKTEFVVAK